MTTHYARQDYPIQTVGNSALVQQQARRRQFLGALLLGIGSFWLYLRLTGQLGDLSMPICWMEGTAIILDHFNIGCDAASVPRAAYGMLTTFTLDRIQ